MIQSITALRKLYYDSPSFDKYLVKTPKLKQKSVYTTTMLARPGYRHSLSTRTGLRFELDDLISVPEKEQGVYLPLRKDPLWTQEIAVDSNSVIDMGHVLCGMDAANYPTAVHFPFPFRFIRVDKNTDAITWIGDLGSVVAEYYYSTNSGKNQNREEVLQQLIDEYSPPADNLANVHSAIIASIASGKKDSNDISSILNNFYQCRSRSADSLRRHSFLFFAQSIGLEWDGVQFTNLRKISKKYTRQTGNAAAMYLAVAAKRKGLLNLAIAFPSVLKLRHQDVTASLIDHFFEALRQEIILAGI